MEKYCVVVMCSIALFWSLHLVFLLILVLVMVSVFVSRIVSCLFLGLGLDLGLGLGIEETLHLEMHQGIFWIRQLSPQAKMLQPKDRE
jgi:hypothetical protein